jgi:hypothetical protein
MSSRKQTKRERFEKNERRPSLQDNEETETGLWVEQQLNRIHDFLVEHGADDQMLEAVGHLLDGCGRLLARRE